MDKLDLANAAVKHWNKRVSKSKSLEIVDLANHNSEVKCLIVAMLFL